MTSNDNDDLAWVEKYRPITVEDCILPDRIKNQFIALVNKGTIPNLFLTGPAGTGKTTIAKALCNDLNYEYLLVNASKDRNLGVLNTLSSFASTVSLDGKKKVIILDEADGLSNSGVSNAQAGLRALIEEYKHVRFILTANFKNKIITPIHSRCATIEFNIKSNEKQEMMIKFLQRVFEILKQENVKYDKTAVADIVKKYYPDNRSILNRLQKYSASGEITTDVLKDLEHASVDTLLKFIRERDLGGCRKWVADNSDTDIGQLYLDIYERLYLEVDESCILDMIQMVADYQDKASRATNQEINTMGFIASILSQLQFKNG